MRGRQLLAIELSGAHIGSLINFDWEMPSGGRTSCEVTGELRQISHSSSDAVLQLTSRVHDTGGATDEFVLMPGTPVTIMEEL